MNGLPDCQSKKDEELVRLTLQDPNWYGCIMKRYEAKLFWYLKRISGQSDEDLEDILQEVFINVYRNLNDFDQTLKFSSWIYRIAHNMAIGHYRKQQARPQTFNGEEAEKIMAKIGDESDLQEETYKRMRSDELRQLIDKLDQKYREVIILRYLEEKDYGEISDILKKPVGTIATLLNRAKKQLTLLMNDNIEL